MYQTAHYKLLKSFSKRREKHIYFLFNYLKSITYTLIAVPF
jgi:hypothetical protein